MRTPALGPRIVLARAQPGLVPDSARHTGATVPAGKPHGSRLTADRVPVAGVLVACQERILTALRTSLDRPIGVGVLDSEPVGTIGYPLILGRQLPPLDLHCGAECRRCGQVAFPLRSSLRLLLRRTGLCLCSLNLPAAATLTTLSMRAARLPLVIYAVFAGCSFTGGSVHSCPITGSPIRAQAMGSPHQPSKRTSPLIPSSCRATPTDDRPIHQASGAGRAGDRTEGGGLRAGHRDSGGIGQQIS